MSLLATLPFTPEPVSLSAGDHVFRQGDTDRRLYVVESGLLKAYYLSEDGRETIKSFIQASDVIGSLSAAYQKGPCSFSLVCQEDSIVAPVDFDALLAESAKRPELAATVIRFLLSFAMKKERRERELLCLSAEARYRDLLDRSPDLLHRLKQKDIARYLGITPVALSRIRSRTALSAGEPHGDH
ncbi:MAG: Crp/Fnr family transcriptional regulator [Pseudomonadota bacterium]